MKNIIRNFSILALAFSLSLTTIYADTENTITVTPEDSNTMLVLENGVITEINREDFNVIGSSENPVEIYEIPQNPYMREIVGGGYTKTSVVVTGVYNFATKSTDSWVKSSLFNNTASTVANKGTVTYSRTTSYSLGTTLTSEQLSVIKAVAFSGTWTNSASTSTAATIDVPAKQYGWIENRPIYVRKTGNYVINYYNIAGKLYDTKTVPFDIYVPAKDGTNLRLELAFKNSTTRPN